ncbi:MAG: hypothetical protein V2A70_10065 [Candidatus Omnitrophota bacterium]
MSIIHDALKKVQQTQPPCAGATKPAKQPQSSQKLIKQNDNINIPLLVAAICAVVAMIFAALPYAALRINLQKPQPTRTILPQKKIVNQPATKDKISNAITLAVAPPVNLPATTPAPLTSTADNDNNVNIHLEGILDMGGKKAALINGEIFEEGQIINGKKILAITFNAMTLMDNGIEHKISLKLQDR